MLFRDVHRNWNFTKYSHAIRDVYFVLISQFLNLLSTNMRLKHNWKIINKISQSKFSIKY